jgi:hypothetical protein
VSDTKKATSLPKKTIEFGETVSFEQPMTGKDWVTVTVYQGGGSKTVKIKRSFSIKNLTSKAITIQGVSSTPTLWLNGKELA